MDKEFTYGQLLCVLMLDPSAKGNSSPHDLVRHILRLPENDSYGFGNVSDMRYVMRHAKEQILEQYPGIRNAVDAYCEALRVQRQLDESYKEQTTIQNYMLELERIKDGTWTKENSSFLSASIRYGLGDFQDGNQQEKAIKKYCASIKRQCFDLEERWMNKGEYKKLRRDCLNASQNVQSSYAVLEKALIECFNIAEPERDSEANVKFDTKIHAGFEQISDAKIVELKNDFRVLSAPSPKGWGKPANSIDAGHSEIGDKVSRKIGGRGLAKE